MKNSPSILFLDTSTRLEYYTRTLFNFIFFQRKNEIDRITRFNTR